jgi:extradiol dioxygenase family protein
LEKRNLDFILPPQIRYAGGAGEQHTMFVLDFSGNPIEFKAFKNEDEIFKKQTQ